MITAVLVVSILAMAALALVRPRHALWALLLYIPLNELVRTVLFDRSTLGLVYKDVLFLAVLGGWLLGALARGRITGARPAIAIPLAFFIAWSLIEFVNPSLTSSYAGFLQFRVQCLYPLLIIWAADSMRAGVSRRELTLFVGLGALEALYGIVQQFIPPAFFLSTNLIARGARAGATALGQFLVISKHGTVMKSFGSTANPPSFGAYMAIVAILCLALFHTAAPRAKLLLLGGFALSLVALYFSLVRTPWLIFLIASGLYLAMTYGRWRTAALGAIFLVVLFNAPIPVLQARLSSAFGQDSTLAPRVATTNDLLPSALADPVGSGIGNDGVSATGVLIAVAGGTENVYVKIAQEDGLIGFIFFVWLRLGILWALWQAAARSEGRDKALARAAFALTVGFFVADYSSFYTEDLPAAWVVWALVGTVLGWAPLAARAGTTMSWRGHSAGRVAIPAVPRTGVSWSKQS